MSDNENGTAGAVDGMAAADVKFLVTCLQNTTGGSISIDKVKVADLLKFKNVNSVANKLTILKKKYNLPIGSATKFTPEKANGSRKTSEPAGPNEPAVPKTPSKQRVVKPRATSSTTKKKATPKSKKDKVEDAKAEDEDEDMSDEAADKEAESKAAYEQVFGKDEDEDEGAEDEEEDAYAA